MHNNSKKVVLVTGAARRIGVTIASHLHASGFNVLLHCNRSRAEADKVCAQLNEARADSACVVQADLSQAVCYEDIYQQAMAAWGGVHALVNNASVFYPTPVNELRDEDWDMFLNIHIKAPFFLAQQFFPQLKQHKGSIVNVVDIHTERPLKEYLAYSVSKAGLVALTKSLARELAPDVRCNAVAPGAILWPEQGHHHTAQHAAIIARTALKREGQPQDVAAAVLFLLEYSNYTTGQMIVVDGGRTLAN